MKNTILTIMLLAVLIAGNSQTMSIDNIRKVALRTSDAIREGTDVKGYYFFTSAIRLIKKRTSTHCGSWTII